MLLKVQTQMKDSGSADQDHLFPTRQDKKCYKKGEEKKLHLRQQP